MTITKTDISDEILAQLRKIVRAMDIQSRQLQRDCALTGPQLVLLREIVQRDNIAIGTLANLASLSNATVTGIVDRLEQRGLVIRARNDKDRRKVLISATESGRAVCSTAPPLMQEKFLAALSQLQQWEQAQILSSLSHLAAMMNGTPETARPMKEEETALVEGAVPDSFLAACQMLLDKETEVPESPASPAPTLPLKIVNISSDDDLAAFMTRDGLARFLNEHLRPYQDTVEDILRGLEYALSDSPEKGGFILLALLEDRPVGALVLLNTGMTGYVPEHLLLFVAVDAAMRGRGIGAQLIAHAQRRCAGDIKLHVEYDNPARRLYERMGFSSKYADMRWTHE